MIFFLDASLSGWGASCNQVTSRGPWSQIESAKHINELELLEALYALQVYTVDLTSISIRLYMDNSTAVAYVNYCGGTVSRDLCDVALKISHLCESRDISIQAVYLPGILNVEEDAESRALPRVGDWHLCPDIFALVAGNLTVEIDLFAAAWNDQLTRFASWDPQPGAEVVEAFLINWKHIRGYLFPPFSLVQRCLVKYPADDQLTNNNPAEMNSDTFLKELWRSLRKNDMDTFRQLIALMGIHFRF